MNILIAVDDTDDITKETSTGEIAGLIEHRLKEYGAVIHEGISRHQLLISDEIAYTSHNSSMCLELELKDMSEEELISLCESVILSHMAKGSDPGLAICFADRLKNPAELIKFGFEAKSRVIQKDEAFALADASEGVVLKELGGTGLGVIGALAGLGLRLSRSDGSMRGKCCSNLSGRSVKASELAGKCGVREVITSKGDVLDKNTMILVEGFVKLMYFDGRLCVMAKENEDGVLTAVSRHQDREKVVHAEGRPVCSGFVPDNDEEEYYFANGSRSCFNCLYRRWTGNGFRCMKSDKSDISQPALARYVESEKGEDAKKRFKRDTKESIKGNLAENMSGDKSSPIYDVAVIGGGICGAMTAWKLSEYKLKILVIDREYDIGEGETKANSGVLYPGIHARGGSLKGIASVKGGAMYDEICRDLDIPLKRVGSLYTAFSEEGLEKMMSKYERGLENGVTGMKIISGDEARKMEPGLSEKVIKAIYNPTTGIISPFTLVTALAEAAVINGAEFRCACTALDIISKNDGTYTIITDKGSIRTRYIVNAAGDGAALIESCVRPQDLVIRPKRGQFYIFDKQTVPVISHVIYQAADNDEGGTLIAPTVSGNIIAGPTSDDVRDFNVTDTTQEGLDHIERVARKILPGIDMGQVIANFAGTRANIANVEKEHKDFVVRTSSPGFISLLGIKNPGMTAAPYLTDMIVEALKKEGMPSEKKSDFIRKIKRQKPFCQLSSKEQEQLWKTDSRYGRIICRCEQITEGDIINVLHSPLPPRSINGLKKRLRAGMGRCQGAFCTARIIEIICRETGAEPEEILKSTDGSNLVKGRLK